MTLRLTGLKAEILLQKGNPIVPSAVYELEDGSLVAVSFWQERTGANTLSCAIAAWQVESNGVATTVHDEDGVVLVQTKHNTSPQQLASLGVQGIATAMVGLVLGAEAGTDPVIPWSDQHRHELNIRNAIAIAKAMTEEVTLVL